MERAMYRVNVVSNERVKSIVNAIEADIQGRKGLGNYFDEIDDDIQAEIRESWENIIVSGIEDKNKQIPNNIANLGEEQCLELLYSYDNYIKDNIENNEEFGKSWVPVGVEEFFDNEFREGI